ncbi:MAG: prepilin-type N-terminal cleavage/methylation domain-containing protein [Thiocapsa sp.]|uniref:prepilin-type N-terminal cleavage/methylation domain-containing protein n=1 Tax=Thiocapsa sp. TaxID=2024551 RepID=UPI001BCAC122|nr:prepilin-type N-terminal cleavage/methylation domain-containing protein [Thiocapsa sp.]QVL49323.1 MAG: prepilin-type N-terminal cleavage/methylation domain-containing protein [Thiocapsa sp.]
MVERIPDKRDGFTLVEMMVTLAIIAFLGLTAVPLTQRLIHSAQVDTADAQLMQAIAVARSLAMRNPGGLTDGTPAAQIDYDEETQTVSVRVPSGDSVWEAVLSPGIEITRTSGNFPLEITNKGRPLGNFGYRISKGNEYTDSSPF